jgi:hypothetical protein
MFTFISVIRFFDLLVAGLMAGMMVSVWLGPNTRSLSEGSYIENTKVFIAAFNKKMPVLFLLSLLLTLTLAILQLAVFPVFSLLITAVIFLIFSGMITRFGNRPIDKQILRWSVAYIPDKWEYFIGRWRYFNNFRTLFVLLAFVFIIFSGLCTP